MTAKPWETNEEMLSRVAKEKTYLSVDDELEDTLQAERIRRYAKDERKAFRCDPDESCGARDE